MKVRFSDDADADLQSIEAFIGHDNRRRALTFARELIHAAIAIGDSPKAYPVLALAGAAELRRKIHGSYLIIYRVHAEHVEIVRVLHGARDIVRVLGDDLP